MLNRNIQKYIEDYYRTSRNVLLVTGARQVGKSYTIRKFGKTFKHFVEVNFIENPAAVGVFKGATSVKDILFRLSAVAGGPLVPGETLVFFDEVQECPEIVTAMKFLVEEGSYRYILSGSLLGVELNDLRSNPVGYMGVKEMFPLDFEEFISNLGVPEGVIAETGCRWQDGWPVDEVVHDKLMELFRMRLIIGGMPAVVEEYVNTNNLDSVLALQREIVEMYRRDVSKYAPVGKRLAIKEIFDLVPSELNAKNKRFVLKRLNEHAKWERYKDGFLWLKDAGVVLPVFNVEAPVEPLRLAELRNLFKLFSNDVGLLASQYADGLQLRILAGDKDINYGSVYENAVAQEMVAHGLEPRYFSSKKRGEVDFLVSIGGNVLPVEVKSGKDYDSHRALANILSCPDYKLKSGLVLSNENLKEVGNVLYAPVYMSMFLRQNDKPIGVHPVDLSPLLDWEAEG